MIITIQNIKLSKLIKGNTIVSGSSKNNSIPIKKNESSSGKLLFISKYRDWGDTPTDWLKKYSAK